MAEHHCKKHVTPLVRFYIDTRPMVRWRELPLIEKLPMDDREKINRFARPADKLMALASCLLKAVFIHRYAQIPWRKVEVQRTPPPHRRPHWTPPLNWPGEGGLEFNVTHQAGMVALVGCQTPPNRKAASPHDVQSDTPNVSKPRDCLRLGVDVSCANEAKRTPKDIISQAKLDEWVDVFGEMFSDRERYEMKTQPIANPSRGVNMFTQKLRRFYAYWALKEAYIKMCGEGLLASWLRQLEFSKVVAPLPAENSQHTAFAWVSSGEEIMKWSPADQVERDTIVHLNGQRMDGVDKGVETEISAYEEDFLFVICMRGVTEPPERRLRANWIKLDIERDIRPCAEGRCSCLEQKVVNRAAPIASPLPLDGDINPFYNIIGAQLRA